MEAGSPYTWTPTAGGTYNWNNASGQNNWGQGTALFPNAVGDVVNIINNLAAAQTINLNQNTTLGTLSIGDSGSTYYAITVAPGAPLSSLLIFDDSSGTATITKNSNTVTDVITANVRLDKTLRVNLGSSTGGLKFSGMITNSSMGLTLDATGTGTVTLGVANQYTGTTLVNGGTLQYGIHNALSNGPVTVSGGTLNMLTYTDVVGVVTLSSGVITGTTATLAFSSFEAQSGRIGVKLAGTGVLTKTTSGTVLVTGANAHTGTVVSAGTLIASNATALCNTAGTVSIGDGATLQVKISGTIGALADTGDVSLHTGTLELNTNMTLTVGAPNNLSSFYSGEILGAGGLTKSSNGVLTLAGENSYTGLTTISLGTIKGGAVNVLPHGTGKGLLTISAVNTSIFDPAGYDQTINGFGVSLGMVSNSTGNARLFVGDADTNFASAVVMKNRLGAPLSLTKIGMATNVLSGILSFGGDVTVSNGVLVLSGVGVNTYTNGTLIQGGTLIISNAAACSTGAVSIADGGELQLGIASTVGALADSSDVSLHSSRVNLRTFTLTVGAPNNLSSFYSGEILGAGGLTKASNGVLTLAGNNNYTGLTTISLGTIKCGAVDVLPHGTGKGLLAISTANTSIFDLGGFDQTINGFGTSVGLVTNSSATAARLTIGDANTNFTANPVIQDGVGTLSLTKIGIATNTLGGLLNFQGDLTVQEGVLVLNKANLYTNETRILGGTLRYAVNNAISNGAVVISGGTLDLVSFIDAVGSVTLTNGRIIGSGMLTGTAFNVESGFIGTKLAGTGVLTKTTAGLLTLTNVSTYSGGTVIQDGTVRVVNASAAASVTGTNRVSFNGGRLEGFGNIMGTLTMADGCVLAPGLPGSSNGVLRVTNLIWTAGATYECSITNLTSGTNGAGLDYDSLVVTGLSVVANGDEKPIIKLDSLGAVLDVDPASNYWFKVITASGSTPLDEVFQLDTNAFQTTVSIPWKLQNVGNSIYVYYQGTPGVFNWALQSGGNWSTGWVQRPFYPLAPGDQAIMTNNILGSITNTVNVNDAVMGSLAIGFPGNTNTIKIAGANALTFSATNEYGTNSLVADASNEISVAIKLDNPMNVFVDTNSLLTLSGGVSAIGANPENNYLGQYGAGILVVTGVNDVVGSDLVASGPRGVIRIGLANLAEFRRLALHGGIIEVLGGGELARDLSGVSANGFYWGDVADGYAIPGCGTADAGGFAAKGGTLVLTNTSATLDGALLIGQPYGSSGDSDGLVFGSPGADSPVVFRQGLDVGQGATAPTLDSGRNVTVLDNPASEDDYFDMQGTTPADNLSINKRGAGLWIWSDEGAQGQRHPIGIREGELRLHGDFSYMAGVNSWIQIFDNATLGGHGLLPAIKLDAGASVGWISPGCGKGSPAAGILTAPSLVNAGAGLGFEFELAVTEPDLASRTNSLNDVLRLTGATPFDVSLSATNTVKIYFKTDSVSGGTFKGAFHATELTPAQLLSAITNATFAYYLKMPGGAERLNGTNYISVHSADVTVSTETATGGGALAVFTLAAQAGTYVWAKSAAGPYNWNNAAGQDNWDPGTNYPNATGVVAIIENVDGAQTINLNRTNIIGTLKMGDAVAPFWVINLAPNGGKLVFDDISGMALLVKNANTVTDTNSASIQLKKTLRVDMGSSSGGLVLSGVISEASPGMGLIKDGAGSGALILSVATNTYTGPTVVNAGILDVTSASSMPSNSAIVVAGGTLRVNNNNNITLAASVTMTNGVIDSSLANKYGILVASRYDVESGVISASLGYTGTLRKTTAGLLVLSSPNLTTYNVNTYYGRTVIDGGTVRVANASAGYANGVGCGSATGTNTVSLNNGTLEGDGVIGGSVTLADNTFVSPGLPGSNGVLTVGPLTWTAGATYYCTVTNVTRKMAGIGVDFDNLLVNGPVSVVPVDGKKPVIQVDSLGQAVTFDPAQNYALKVVTVNGGTGPSATDFQLDTNAFLAAGPWVLTNAGNSIYLYHEGNPSASSGLYTWSNAAGGKWSEGWAQYPFYPNQPGDEAVIALPTASDVTIVIDKEDATVGSLTLDNPDHSYTIAGPNALNLAAVIGEVTSAPTLYVNTGTQIVSAPMVMVDTTVQVNVTACAGARARLTGVMSGGPTSSNRVAVYVAGGDVEVTGTNTYVGITRLGGNVRTTLYATLSSIRKVQLPTTVGGGDPSLSRLVFVGGGTWTPKYIYNDPSVDVNDLWYGGQTAYGPPSISTRGGTLRIQLVPGTGSSLWRDNGPNSINCNFYNFTWPWGDREWDANIVLTDNVFFSGASKYMDVYDNPNSDDDFLELDGVIQSGSVYYNSMSGKGTLEVNHPTNLMTAATTINGGTLRVNGRLGATVAGNTVVLNSGSCQVSGRGSLYEISGFGLVNPGKDGTSALALGENTGILTLGKLTQTNGATAADSTRLAFEFTAREPDLTNPTNSLNDVLRLTNAAPFTTALGVKNTVNVYFKTSPYGFHKGAFLTDTLLPASLLTAIANAGFAYYRPDPAGSVVFNGATYSALDTVANPVTVSTESSGSGAITVFYIPPRGNIIIMY